MLIAIDSPPTSQYVADLATTWERRGRSERTDAVTMSRPTSRPTRGGQMRISRSVPVFALALVAACAGPSSQAIPKVRAQSPRAPSRIVASTTPSTRQAATPPTTSGPAASGADRPIKLVGDADVTPAELERAERLLESTIAGLERFESPSQAYAAGYRSIGDTASVDEHSVNWSYIDVRSHP